MLKKELTELIIDYFSSTALAIFWNGEILELFHPTQVLRQGDPLSPYSFILCMEVLSQKIMHAIDQKKWMPLRVGCSGSRMSHIFFAVDLL